MRDSAEHLQHSGAEDALFTIVVATASVVGDDYFTVLPRVLAQTLGTTGAFVAETVHSGAATSVTLLGAQPSVGAVTLESASLAMEPATRGKLAYVPQYANESYPEDAFLAKTGAKACLAIPVYGERGEVLGVVGLIDSTSIPTTLPGENMLRLAASRVGAEIERRRAIRDAQTSFEMLQRLTDRSQDLITRLRLQPTFAFEYVSPSAERLLGYSPEEFYSDPTLVYRIVHPDYRASLAALYSGDDTVPMRSAWTRRDGSTLWCEGKRTAIRNDQGEVVAYETFMRDITAQRDAEEELALAVQRERSLLAAVPDLMIRLSPVGRILDVHAPREAHSPIAEPVIGALIDDAFPREARGPIRSALEVGESTDVRTLTFEVAGDGGSRTIECRFIWSDADSAVVFMRDVTAERWFAHEPFRHQTREELELAAEQRIALSNRYGLTFREFTVLDLLRGGPSDKELAVTLGISTGTASKHVSNILAKMDAGSRTEAVARAITEGLLD